MIVDFSKTNLSILEQISVLQRMIILHSILYYELDNSVLTDKSYDELSRQLVTMQKSNDTKDTDYYYCMYDFDGNTGFDLYNRLSEKDKTYLKHIALSILMGNSGTRRKEKYDKLRKNKKHK